MYKVFQVTEISGFCFPCNQKGKIILKDLPKPAKENYKNCLANIFFPDEIQIKDNGIRKISDSFLKGNN